MDLTSGEAAWSISVVSERTGITKATLRVWDIRYGLAPTATTPGGHRRYSSDDVEVLLAVRQLTEQGVPAADAARSVLGRHSALLGLPAESSPAAQRLAYAAMRLDGPTCMSVLDDDLRAAGVTGTWESVLRPVLRAVGGLADESALGIAVEHVLSHVATVSLARITAAGTTGTGPPVLLACTPGELHELPMNVLAADLSSRGRATTLIGARTPADSLSDAVRQARAGVVVLFSAVPECADPATVTPLLTGPTVLAAGPGWADTALPSGIRRVNGLSEAVAAVRAAG
jgi:MerR family transcriptional regulator, light-induced transcriptional regulator